MYKRIASCRICGNQNLVKVLDLGEQALTGRFPLPLEPDPTSGPLELVACMGDDPAQYCGLLQLSCSYVLSEMYGPTYGYRSSLSQTMVRHLLPGCLSTSADAADALAVAIAHAHARRARSYAA